MTEIAIRFTPTGWRHVVLSQATYAPFGPVTGWIYGAGLAMRRPVDLNYRPQAVEVVHTDTAGVQTAVGLRLRYAFDAVGNLVRLEDSRTPGAVKRRFGYDGLDRLANTRTADDVALQTYTYDATGNRTALTERIPVFGGGTTTYQTVNHSYTYPANSHRLTAVNGVSRSYDAAGNLTQIGDAATPGGPRQFGYDANNRMAQVGKPTQVDATYVYSGAGERVRKTAAGVETYSLHDAAGRWIGDYDSNGAPIQQAIWLGDLPVGLTMTVPATAGQTQQKLFHLQPDMLGTPRVAVDPYRGSKGTVVWTWDLEGEAFGNEPTQQDPDGDGMAFKLDMRFPGQRYDAATGLNYNYFRDYEAGTGRYVQSDPIGLAGGVSLYGYVGGKPLIGIDPFGLEILGIHSSAQNNDPSPASGHAWLAIYADNGRLLETWGAFLGTHELANNAPNGCECDNSNVCRDIEKNNSMIYAPEESLYILMTPEELASLRQFIAQPWEFGKYRSNCAAWVDTAVEHVFPVITMNVTDFRALGATTPRALSGNLHEWSQQFPKNSVRNPLNQPQGWRPPK